MTWRMINNISNKRNQNKSQNNQLLNNLQITELLYNSQRNRIKHLMFLLYRLILKLKYNSMLNNKLLYNRIKVKKYRIKVRYKNYWRIFKYNNKLSQLNHKHIQLKHKHNWRLTNNWLSLPQETLNKIYNKISLQHWDRVTLTSSRAFANNQMEFFRQSSSLQILIE